LSVVITTNISLSGLDLSCPYILWHSLVTDSNLASNVAASAAYPLSNLGNPMTHQLWEGNATSTTVYVTLTTSYTDLIDGVGVAAHNFGSAGIQVGVETSPDLSTWTSQASAIPTTDDPLLFRIPANVYAGVRLALTVGAVKPRAAVLFVHKMLIMERSLSIDVDHPPVNLNRLTKVAVGRSTGGSFLGQVVISESRKTKADFKWITPGFYRGSVDPFIKSSQSTPFFFAWSPAEYPADVGYCWMLDDPVSMQDTITRRFALTMSMQGIA
jgi:hypothetical protein